MRLFIQGIVLGLVALATWLSAGEASADPKVRFGVSFGNGGVRVGVGSAPIYGPGYYGPGYGPGYGYGHYHNHGYGYGYGPPPVVIAPQSVYVPQPVYVQPQPAYAPPQPIPQQRQYVPVTREPLAPPAPTPSPDGGEILLFSPGTNLVDVPYTLNGHPYTMLPGTKQRFTNDRTWTIEFESAPGQVTTYTLVSARYKFKPSPTGLGLFQTQDTPETAQSTLPAAPIPSPPVPSEDDAGAVVVPPRPALKTTP